MEVNKLQSQSANPSGDDPSLPGLPSAAEDDDEVTHARDSDVLSEGEDVPTQASTRKRPTPAWAGMDTSTTAKRLRARSSTSSFGSWTSRESEPLFPPEETERWVEIMAECNADAIEDSRPLAPVWDRLARAFALEYPGGNWTKETTEARLKAEMKRCNRFLDTLGLLDSSLSGETDEGGPLGQYIDPITPREVTEEEDLTTDDEGISLGDEEPFSDHEEWP